MYLFLYLLLVWFCGSIRVGSGFFLSSRRMVSPDGRNLKEEEEQWKKRAKTAQKKRAWKWLAATSGERSCVERVERGNTHKKKGRKRKRNGRPVKSNARTHTKKLFRLFPLDHLRRAWTRPSAGNSNNINSNNSNNSNNSSKNDK